ncbi:MAG: acyl--CoA ligase, partial [Candidatus Rokubacteria bacterium]|nr:acyl--CoA ligase [Candidatus Rokubacteria bacterium]
MNAGYEILSVAASRWPDRVALIGDWGQMTFRDLEARAARVAAGLARLGVRAGDRVGYMMNNHPEVVVAYFAVLRLGAVAVATNVMLRPTELAYLLNDSGTVGLVCEPDVADTVLAAGREAPGLRWIAALGDRPPAGTIAFGSLDHADDPVGVAERHPDDLAMLMYTSGTTGSPKGVMMSHAWLDFTTFGWIRVDKLSGDDRFLDASPFFYAI